MPAPQLELPFLSQLPISPGHRIVIYTNVRGELPDRGELVPRAESTRQESSTQASHNLLAGRQG
jgi:hypothetical protein